MNSAVKSTKFYLSVFPDIAENSDAMLYKKAVENKKTINFCYDDFSDKKIGDIHNNFLSQGYSGEFAIFAVTSYECDEMASYSIVDTDIMLLFRNNIIDDNLVNHTVSEVMISIFEEDYQNMQPNGKRLVRNFCSRYRNN